MTAFYYALMLMWFLGCLGALWAMLYYLWDEGSHVATIVLGLIGVPAALVIGALPYGLYLDSSGPTIELQKSEWSCTRAHKETTTSYVMSGKVMVPITTTDDVCDAYERITHVPSY